jgi:hypothetical protein
MPSIKHYVTLIAALAPLALTGCGDGWVTQKYEGVPYAGKGIDSDERTAGYGVEYVRAAMMPSKGPMTEAVTPPPAPPPPAPVPAAAPVRSAEPIYNKAQEK